MKLLKEIKDMEIPSDTSGMKMREASRAVLFDNNGKIPMLFLTKFNYHKLPGGGIEKGEDKMQALIREIKEEVGSEIEVTDELGIVVEYRSKYNLRQTSYCYLGKILSKGEPTFTRKERSAGSTLVWLKLDEAISAVQNDKPNNYEGMFIQKRDIEFLAEAKKVQMM